MDSGVIQRGGSLITSTQDLGLYSRLSGRWLRFVTDNAPIHFFTSNGSNGNGSDNRMTIQADGNVGIGTTNPSKKLEVSGDATITGQLLAASMSVTGNSTLTGSLTVNNTVELKGSANETGLTINTNGNVGIGISPGPEKVKIQGDTSILGALTAVNITGEGAVISGMIIMWFGNTENIPSGWAPCDGRTHRFKDNVLRSVPDLQGRFIVGANGNSGSSSTYAVGKTGGASKVRLTIAQMPRHNHANGDYKYLLKSDGNATANKTDYTVGEPNLYNQRAIQPSGGGQSHENLPPFHALFFIIKL